MVSPASWRAFRSRTCCALVAIVLSLFALLPVKAQESKDTPYVAVICSPDLSSVWLKNKKWKADCFSSITKWSQFRPMLDLIKLSAGERPIILDMEVHGSRHGNGLWLQIDDDHGDNATFGFALNEIHKSFADHYALILFESCFAALNYKNTIRGAGANEGDSYLTIPPFPVIASSENCVSFGNLTYLQWRHNFKKYWLDLRDYDPLGLNKPVMKQEFPKPRSKETLTEREKGMREVYLFFRENIP